MKEKQTEGLSKYIRGILIMPLHPVSQPFARGGLLVGSLLMLILILVSVTNFNAFNTVINFIYLPLDWNLYMATYR